MAQVQLPGSVTEMLGRLEGPTEVSHVVEAALTRVMEGTSAERFALMQEAMPIMEGPTQEVTLEAPQALVEEFNQYCDSKGLRADVLLTGALLVELGKAEPRSAELPEHCRTEPPSRRPER